MAHLAKWCDAMYQDSIPGATLRANGYAGVMAYTGTPGYVKDLNPAVYQDWAAAGIGVIAIYENNANDATADPPSIEYTDGVNHANALLADARAIGLPNTTAVCATCDEHLTSAQISQAVQYQTGFFNTVRAAGWLGRVGCYGFSEFIYAAQAAGVADWFWCCGSAASIPGWTTFWQDNTQTTSIGGVSADIDWLLNLMPSPLSPPPPPEDTMGLNTQWIVDAANGRAYCSFEVGTNSQTVANLWVSAKSLYGDIPNAKVVFTDDTGNIVPAAGTNCTTGQNPTFLKNDRIWWQAPVGSSDVTIEWDATKATGALAPYLTWK